MKSYVKLQDKARNNPDMDRSIFDDMGMCFSTLESCQKSCTGWQCVRVDQCNGLSSSKYACFPIDSRFLTWILLGSFLIVLLSCSLLILCYTCWLLQTKLRYPIRTNYEIVFHNRLPFRTYSHA